MFEVIRKYSSTVMLILMGMVLVCLVADDFAYSQHLTKQAAMSANVTILVDDLDFDDDNSKEDHKLGYKTFATTRNESTTIKTFGDRKCPMALLRGQVRRYSPRNDPADGNNYTLLTITKSGVDLFHVTFFVQFKII